MSKIDELIEELCPEGVPRLQLNELVTFEKGAHLSDDDFQPGVFPVVTASRSESRRHAFSNVGPKAVTVTSHGAYAGHVNFWEDAIWLAGNVFLLKPKLQVVSEKFLFYVLKNSEETIQGRARGGGIPYMNSSDLKGLKFLLPPLEVQREIVSILDKFTQLEAELEARRIQYEVTRDRLLDFSGDLGKHPMSKLMRELSPQTVEYKTLGELLESIPRGKRLTKAELPENGTIPVFHGGLEPIGFTDQANTEAMTVMVINVGASAGSVGWSEEPFWCSDGCFALPHASAVLPKYLYYCALANQRFFVERVRKAGIPTLAPASVLTLSIPVPPLEIQSEIVSILDKLDALVNDITIGLPAEIAARRKQYEYYRNKLLTFKELEAA